MITHPHAATNANGINYCYDQAGNQVSGSDGRSIQYSVADQVRAIALTATNKSTRYYYGASRNRYKRMDYPTGNFAGTPKTTLHIGNVEHITHTTGIVETKRYIAGVAIISTRTDGNNKKEYLFTDHLGSTDVITDRFGNADNNCYLYDHDQNASTPALNRCHSSQRMSFDAFGARRKVADLTLLGWTQLDLTTRANFNTDKTKKGFTGHEMVDGVDLIHMNGRMYDPELGRFIQADPFIQDPYNTQSLNRYSYVLNNPLTATDPSGYFSVRDAIAVVLFGPLGLNKHTRAIAVIATCAMGGPGACALANAANTFVSGGSFKDALRSGLTSYATSFAFNQVGNIFDGVKGPAGASGTVGQTGLTLGQFAAKVAAHGIFGGVSAELQGGKFGHGFASAGFGELLSPISASFKTDGGQIAFAAIVGGTASRLAGGKFANGAISSAMGFIFNQLAHPCDFQCKVDKVAMREISAANSLSVKDNAEIGGLIFHFNGEIRTTSWAVSKCEGAADCTVNTFANVAEIPNGGSVIASWHTHGRNLKYSHISNNDVRASNIDQINLQKIGQSNFLGEYVGTPSGAALFYKAGSLPNDVSQQQVNASVQFIGVIPTNDKRRKK